MAKSKQFVLTCKESKELRSTGKTTHAAAGIGYDISLDEQGNPFVSGLSLLEAVDFEIVVRR